MDNNYNFYFNKYVKYKRKYYELKFSGGGIIKNLTKNKFYITHSTSSLNNLLKIIDTKTIKLGTDVPKTYKKNIIKSTKNIYGNIFFDEITKNNILNDKYKYLDYTIILHPKILSDYTTIINNEWTTEFLTKESYQIYEIKKYIERILEKDEYQDYVQTHQIVFSKKIPISKYILAVTCNNCEDDYEEKFIQIKKFLKRNGLNHVKILSKKNPVLLSEL